MAEATSESWFGSPPLLADGPPACALCGVPGGLPPAALNASEPERVGGVHARERKAGAQLLRTNTRDATRLHLAPLGLGDRTEAINNSGSALARHAAGEAFVAGSVTPIVRPPGMPAVHPDERERAYSEQLIYLSDTGVEFFLLEHFADVAEAERVVSLAGHVSEAPVMALLVRSAVGDSATLAGLAAAGERLLRAGADALGLSCHVGSAEPLSALAGFGVPLGMFARPGDHGSPAAYARTLASAVEAGAAIVGGCCGAGAAHTAAMARYLGRAAG